MYWRFSYYLKYFYKQNYLDFLMMRYLPRIIIATMRIWDLRIQFRYSAGGLSLRVSSTILINPYMIQNTPDTKPGLHIFPVQSFFQNKSACTINKKAPSQNPSSRFVFRLNWLSTLSKILIIFHLYRLSKLIDPILALKSTTLPYNSWFRLFPILPNKIPNGRNNTIKSNRYRISSATSLNFFLI